LKAGSRRQGVEPQIVAFEVEGKNRRSFRVSVDMGRNLRYLPRSGMLVEVTCRTIQGRFLLRPGQPLNEIFIGCLAKARGLFAVDIHAVVVLSTHYHLLVSPADSEQLANFMKHLNTNLSKEIGALHDWPGTIFNRRYRAIVVADEAAVQIARLRYLLSHGAKEGVVYSPACWPGVNSVEALLTGKPLRGTWFDRSREFAARQRRKSPSPRAFATEMEVALQPLPCWRHLPPDARQDRVRGLIEEIEKQTLAMHGERGTEPIGSRRARKVHPHHRPSQVRRSPAPRFHAWSRRQRRRLESAYAEFVAAYRVAAERWRAGDCSARFPDGSFPPAMPFVRAVESVAPG